MKLSDNFCLSDFLKDRKELTPVQIFMLKSLSIKILEPIKSFLKCDIKILDGARFPADLNRLRKEGYKPSEDSDHLLGNVVRLKTTEKKSKYGLYYSYSVGAADFIPDCGALTAWDKLKPYFNKVDGSIDLPVNNRILPIKIGQIILEDKNKTKWIHISNPKELIYSTRFINSYLNSKKFLQSLNNGENYLSII